MILLLLDSHGSGGSLLFLNKIVGSRDRIKSGIGAREHFTNTITAKEEMASTVTKSSRRILTSITVHKEIW